MRRYTRNASYAGSLSSSMRSHGLSAMSAPLVHLPAHEVVGAVHLHDLTCVARGEGFGRRAGVALRARGTCRTLRPGVALRPRLPLWSGRSGRSGLTGIAHVALFAHGTRRPRRPRGAVRTVNAVNAIASVPAVNAVNAVVALGAGNRDASEGPHLLCECGPVAFRCVEPFGDALPVGDGERHAHGEDDQHRPPSQRLHGLFPSSTYRMMPTMTGATTPDHSHLLMASRRALSAATAASRSAWSFSSATSLRSMISLVT